MLGFAWPLASSSAAWGGLWGPGPQPRPWGDTHVPTPTSPSPWLGSGSGSRAPRGPPHHAGAFVTVPSAVSLSQPLGHCRRVGSVTAPLHCCIPQLASLCPLPASPPYLQYH